MYDSTKVPQVIERNKKVLIYHRTFPWFSIVLCYPLLLRFYKDAMFLNFHLHMYNLKKIKEILLNVKYLNYLSNSICMYKAVSPTCRKVKTIVLILFSLFLSYIHTLPTSVLKTFCYCREFFNKILNTSIFFRNESDNDTLPNLAYRVILALKYKSLLRILKISLLFALPTVISIPQFSSCFVIFYTNHELLILRSNECNIFGGFFVFVLWGFFNTGKINLPPKLKVNFFIFMIIHMGKYVQCVSNIFH